MRIAWPNGHVHYFGKFTSEKKTMGWIADHSSLTKPLPPDAVLPPKLQKKPQHEWCRCSSSWISADCLSSAVRQTAAPWPECTPGAASDKLAEGAMSYAARRQKCTTCISI